MSYHSPNVILDRKINVAVLGLGRISQAHLDAIERYPDDLNLLAVADSRPDIVANVAERYKVKGYLSLEELLLQTETDLIILCTPSGMHPYQTMQVAKAGRHVLTEKPMATHWQDGLDMVRACEQANLRLFVVKQNRFNPTLQALKKAIDANRFGRIYMLNINVFWNRSQAYYDKDSWRGTRAMDGGAFMNQASHYIDLLHWLMGPVESVQAMMATLARKIESEDSGVMNVRWRNGAMGSVNVNMLTYPKDTEGSVTIVGEHGFARIAGVALNEIQDWCFAEPKIEDSHIKQLNYQTDSVYGFGHPLYYKNVIETLRGEARPLVDGHEGLASLEVLIAAYRAARDGTTVHLPLEI